MVLIFLFLRILLVKEKMIDSCIKEFTVGELLEILKKMYKNEVIYVYDVKNLFSRNVTNTGKN